MTLTAETFRQLQLEVCKANASGTQANSGSQVLHGDDSTLISSFDKT